ncbi:unnamed protein product [Darwinula stevensoni]|uniref:Orn/DAP/Arg decarboxylase 2 N-terminal domain-containing protein n=1 Tax=Darwinula stevensoni TaxID=69355 RepID=A0A7R9A241_9CRUS|nr:unnamed protein product [Darwinula stevensoni]CAG0887916.1 unnamed protein product [Darwinula stevensoni]
MQYPSPPTQLHKQTRKTDQSSSLVAPKMLEYVNGVLHCEDVDLVTLTEGLGARGIPTPYFVYSEGQIRDNANGYLSEIPPDLRDRIVAGYALKANPNPGILGVLRRVGMGAVAVSGAEMRLARREGFPPHLIMFNGNGKDTWEILYAVGQGCLMNIDSPFDASRIALACDELATPASLFIRVKAAFPQLDSVHSYNRTSAGSKFGVALDEVEEILQQIKSHPRMKLIGLHSHLGSTIKDTSTLVENFRFLARLGDQVRKFPTKSSLKSSPLRADGWKDLDILNIGGGLGIDYQRDGSPHAPLPSDLMRHVVSALREAAFPWRLWLEPGRSIVGNAAVLVTRVLGVKGNETKRFAVTDAAMTDLIRPSLYGAYHHISLVVQGQHEESEEMDVVGGVCESGDFLGKCRRLPRSIPAGSLAAIWDAGAYGAVLGSNYNLRPRAAEVLVAGQGWRVIRRRETFDDLVRLYDECD